MTDPVVDLSHWNEGVDFAKLKAAGVTGVIHKCTESTGYVDPTYMKRRGQAEAAGLLWGAYHFLRPVDAYKQARWFVQNVGNHNGVLLAADHEDTSVTLNDLKEFLGIVEEMTGQKAVVYSGHVIKAQVTGHDDFLARHRLWLAQYTQGEPSWPTATWPEWWLWQYTDQGSVSGVSGNVDCNRYINAADDELLALEWCGLDVKPMPDPARRLVTVNITAPDDVDVQIVVNGEEI